MSDSGSRAEMPQQQQPDSSYVVSPVPTKELPPARAKRERPILFSAPMVRALLAGTKTQTRRALNPQPEPWAHGWSLPGYCASTEEGFRHGAPIFKSRFGQPGDRLWVRESWRYCCSMWGSGKAADASVEYKADSARDTIVLGESDRVPQHRPQRDGELRNDYENDLSRWWARSIPSIHMPRWASRILLEVSEVRVQRLQDISEEDAIAEGIGRHRKGGWWWEQPPEGIEGTNHFGAKTARDAYGALWEQVNGPGSWAANPWVWAVSFRVEPRAKR